MVSGSLIEIMRLLIGTALGSITIDEGTDVPCCACTKSAWNPPLGTSLSSWTGVDALLSASVFVFTGTSRVSGSLLANSEADSERFASNSAKSG
jgi:hypothetical protein